MAEENVMPPGTYDFEVATCEVKTSKSGNPMMVVSLKVYDEAGRTRFVTDYLLEAFLPKLLAFCKETGLRGAYDAGTLSPDDLFGKAGKVEIAIEAKGDFPAKNVVKWYGIKASKGATATEPAPATFKPSAAPVQDLEELDDLPF